MNLSYTTLIVPIIVLSFGSAALATNTVPGELLVKYKAGTYSQSLTGGLAKIGWAKIKVTSDDSMHLKMAGLAE